MKCWNFNWNEATKCNGSKGLGGAMFASGGVIGPINTASGDQSTMSGAEIMPPRQVFSPGLRSVSQSKRIGTNQTVRPPTLAQNGAARSTALISNPRSATVGGGVVGGNIARRV